MTIVCPLSPFGGVETGSGVGGGRYLRVLVAKWKFSESSPLKTHFY